jgi:hypothetical protein
MGIVFGKTGVAEPAFDVLLTRSSASVKYQIRKYGVRFACETEVTSGKDGMGFKTLAEYIGVIGSPQNDGGKGIAMTAPVVTEQIKGTAIAMTAPVVKESVGSDKKKMAFMLPAEYDSMDKIPKPTNPNVKISEIPSSTGAAHTFSGSCNDEKAKTKAQELIDQLKNDGVEIDEKEAIENFDLWQFHPPFTIPFLKKNEIWIDLTEEQVNHLSNKYTN